VINDVLNMHYAAYSVIRDGARRIFNECKLYSALVACNSNFYWQPFDVGDIAGKNDFYWQPTSKPHGKPYGTHLVGASDALCRAPAASA
jgi:hypothetical protein